MTATTTSSANPSGGMRRRLAPIIDTTPLVDIAFLLLTFFLFASAMTQPRVMDMVVPPALVAQVRPQAMTVRLLLPVLGSLRGEIDGRPSPYRGEALLEAVAVLLERSDRPLEMHLRVESAPRPFRRSAR